MSTTPTRSTTTCSRRWTWSERFAAQPEILAYLEHVADRFDLRRHYGSAPRSSARLRRSGPGRGRCAPRAATRHRADFLLCATGCLSAVNRPDIPGIDDFAGEVYYTADWPDDEPDFRGKRVGLIGTGSSGIQATPLIAAHGGIADGVPAVAELQRADAQPAVDRRRHATHPAEYRGPPPPSPPTPRRAPHTPATTKPAAETGPREREEALRQRWTQGGVLFSKTFPDQLTDLAANDIAREFAEARIRELVDDPARGRRPDPRPTTRSAPSGSAPTPATTRRSTATTCTLVNLRREPIDRHHRRRGAHQRRRLSLRRAGVRHRIRRDDRVRSPASTRSAPAATGSPTCGPTDRVTFLGLMVPGAAEPVQLQRAWQPVGAGQHGAARRGSGRLGGRADRRRATPAGVDRGRTAPGRRRRRGPTTSPRSPSGRCSPSAQSSWYLGANIEGKKRVFMPYVGGFGIYRTHCDEVAENDYAGLVFTTR